MDIRFEVVGAEELGANLVGVGRAVAGTRLEHAALAGSEVIAKEARRRAPRMTGRGAKSIQGRIIESKPEEVTVAIGPGRDEFYMLFQEFGTAHHPAQPFLRPAFDQNQRQALREARRVFWTNIQAAVGRTA